MPCFALCFALAIRHASRQAVRISYLTTKGHEHKAPICTAGCPHESPERVCAVATGVNPAAFEIAGHIVLKRPEDYDSMSEARAWQLLEHVSVSEERMAELEADVFAAYM